jgi:hypothetical protein
MEGGGIFLEGERGERVHLGEERSEKRKMAYTLLYQAYTLNASLILLNLGSVSFDVLYFRENTPFYGCYYITDDFLTAASQNNILITQQMCHLMILIHN